jgi:hypothetical protein
MYQPILSRSVTYLTLFLINACLLLACKSQSIQDTNSTEVIAKRELGNDIRIELNESKTYALCQQTLANDHANSIVKYVVIQVSDNTVVQKGSFQAGYVKWVSNESIETASADKFSPDLKKQTIQIIQNKN